MPTPYRGYGLASKPATDMSEDPFWRAMLYAMREPAERGLKVDGVTTRDLAGLRQRTLRDLDNLVGCDESVFPGDGYLNVLGTFTV